MTARAAQIGTHLPGDRRAHLGGRAPCSARRKRTCGALSAGRVLGTALLLAACDLRAATVASADASATVPALVRQLDDDDFRVRDRAALLLKNLPGDAWPAVRAALGAKGVSAEARRHLETAGRILAARQLNETRYNDLTWNRESAVAAYDAAGRHSPKWDAAAREALRLYPRPSFDARLRPKDDAARALAFETAAAAGCDDPLFLYCYARLLDEQGDEAPDRLRIDRLYRVASDRIVASDYPAIRKCFALVRNANTLPPSGAVVPLTQALDLLPAAARDQGVRPSHVLALARMCADGIGRGTSRPEGYKAAQAALDAALPGKAEPLLLKGEFLAKLAYEAPADPPAPGAPPQPPPDPHAAPADPSGDAVRRAEQALRDAYALDPTDARAATLMLGLRIRAAGAPFALDDNAGDAERAETDLWFRRATDANPDNYDACLLRLQLIQSDWRRGGPAEMVRFARQCAAGGNYYGRVPFLLVEAHAQASHMRGDRDAYLRDPAVWDEVRAVYETHLGMFPDHDYYRSGYAKWAVDCGRWADAARLLDALSTAGNGPDPRVFGGPDGYDLYRERVQGELARAGRKKQKAR